MPRFALEEVSSGADDGGLWVSLGFVSDLEANDVLHIVGGDADAARDQDDKRLYLERFDQSYSCEHGGDSVLVRRVSIEIQLSEEAREELAFDDQTLVFDVPRRLDGFDDAVRIFGEMSRAGSPVRVEA
jgi:hypothetical protein